MLTKCMKQSRSKGFTLTEVVLAIGVVAVLIVVFMAMFIPARRTVQSALTIREADRIVHALTAELGELRNSERAASNARKSSSSKYVSAFDKAFYWMQFTSRPATLAFSLYPVTMADLFRVADAGEIMPPKSTWFEPKLRSGLFIHTIEQ